MDEVRQVRPDAAALAVDGVALRARGLSPKNDLGRGPAAAVELRRVALQPLQSIRRSAHGRSIRRSASGRGRLSSAVVANARRAGGGFHLRRDFNRQRSPGCGDSSSISWNSPTELLWMIAAGVLMVNRVGERNIVDLFGRQDVVELRAGLHRGAEHVRQVELRLEVSLPGSPASKLVVRRPSRVIARPHRGRGCGSQPDHAAPLPSHVALARRSAIVEVDLAAAAAASPSSWHAPGRGA